MASCWSGRTFSTAVVLVPSPNLSYFQEAGKRRLPAIQVTAAASDRNGFDGSVAVPAGELIGLYKVATLAHHLRGDLQNSDHAIGLSCL